MPPTIFADAIHGVTLSNGVLRIRLAKIVGDNKMEEAGTLLLPANQAGPIISQMANSLKEISDKVKEQQSETLAEEAVAAFETDDAIDTE